MTPEQLQKLPEILFQIGKVIGSKGTLSKTLATISELVTELCDAHACSIMLLDAEKGLLLGKAAYGLHRSNFSEVSFRLGEGIAGWVAEEGSPALIDNIAEDPRFKILETDSSHIVSIACVPLRTQDKIVGVLSVTSEKESAFSNATVDLMHLVANTIGLDIENIHLRRLAVTDKLTGAYNREFLDSQLPICLKEASDRGTNFSVAMLDVDHFKSVNDNYGHDAGDIVLAEIARRLQEGSRQGDLLVRFGGEEFLLLLPRTGLERAAEIANRIRNDFEKNPIFANEQILEIRISGGVATWAEHEEADALVKRADTALYQAKNLGRNRVEMAAPAVSLSAVKET